MPRGSDRRARSCSGREPAAARPVRADEVGVAELADRASAVLLAAGPQVAAGEAAEHRGPAGVGALALEGVEDLLDRVGHPVRPSAGSSAGSARPTSANPRRRSRHESQVPQARPSAVGVVAAVGQGVVDAELQAALDDLRLGQLDQRSVDLQLLPALDPGLGRQVGHLLVGADVLGPAVRVAAVVQGVDADEDVAGLQHLGPGQREGQEDRVAGRNVGDRDLVRQVLGALVVRDADLSGQGRPAEHAQVDVGHDMLGHAERIGDPPGRVKFDAVTLPVAEAERMRDVALRMSDRQHRGGIQPTAEQHHRRLPCHHAHLRPIAVTYRCLYYHRNTGDGCRLLQMSDSQGVAVSVWCGG